MVAKIGILGTGYVGLVSAVCFAKLGHSVVGYDLDAEKINKLRSGLAPIFEVGLSELLNDGLTSNSLRFTGDINELSDRNYIFLCVPTPQDQDGTADLSYVLSATRNLKHIMAKDSCLITKSTVPVKSWLQIQDNLGREDVKIVSNPEFLREGSAIEDFFNPDRIIVGSPDPSVAKNVFDLYQMPSVPAVMTDNTTAELIKYASNSFLALKLSFVNDLAALSEKIDANALQVLKGMGMDMRIGHRFTTPGPGWGGSCFPKDVRALMMTAEAAGVPMPLLSAAWESNERAHRRYVDLASEMLGDSLVGKRIGVWGLAFKAHTDDVRQSPALSIIERVIGRGAEVVAYDPQVKELKSYPNVEVAKELVATLKGVDLIMVLTEWPEFANIEPEFIKSLSNVRKIIDTRGILSKNSWSKAGFNFWGNKN